MGERYPVIVMFRYPLMCTPLYLSSLFGDMHESRRQQQGGLTRQEGYYVPDTATSAQVARGSPKLTKPTQLSPWSFDAAIMPRLPNSSLLCTAIATEASADKAIPDQ